MNILHIIPYFNPAWAYGGSVRVVSELCERLAGKGHQVTVLTTDTLDADHRIPSGEAQVDGVEVHRYRNLSNRLAWNRLFIPPGFPLGLRRKMQDFDVVHLHEYRSLQNAFALPALLKTKQPYIITAHGGLPARLGRSGLKSIYDQLVGNRLLSNAARLHALTEMEQEQYQAMGATLEKTVIIPNGIDLNTFDLDADTNAFKRRFNILLNKPIVGYLGRLSEIKGLDFLIDAFAKVLETLPDAILLLAGPDDGEQANLEQQIDRLGIRQQVRFTGYIGDIETKAAAYRAFNVYVLPSRYENQPTTILESLVNKTPVIVSDRCGIAGQLSGDGIGDAVPFGDVDTLTQGIITVLRQPSDQVTQHTEAGYRYVAERYSWDTIVKQWIDLYQVVSR